MNIKTAEYEFNFEEKTRKLTIRRNGNEWRNETGDNALLALMTECVKHREHAKIFGETLISHNFVKTMTVASKYLGENF